MKISQAFIIVISVFTAYVLIDNPPLIPASNGQVSHLVDTHRLHSYLLVDLLISTIAIVITLRPAQQNIKALHKRRMAPNAAMLLSESSGIVDKSANSRGLTSKLGVRPSAYYFQSAGSQRSTPRVGPRPAAGIYIVCFLVLVLGAFGILFYQNIQPSYPEAANAHQSDHQR